MPDDHGSRKTRLPGGFFVSAAGVQRNEDKRDTTHVDRLASARGQLINAIERSRILPKAKEVKSRL
jgi:hypothetical protein